MERDYWLDIAEKLEAASRAGRTCRLTPETALRLASAARFRAGQPTRDELAMEFCPRKVGEKCVQPCIRCVGFANVAEQAYRAKR